jgi:hypothetical protein
LMTSPYERRHTFQGTEDIGRPSCPTTGVQYPLAPAHSLSFSLVLHRSPSQVLVPAVLAAPGAPPVAAAVAAVPAVQQGHGPGRSRGDPRLPVPPARVRPAPALHPVPRQPPARAGPAHPGARGAGGGGGARG